MAKKLCAFQRHIEIKSEIWIIVSDAAEQNKLEEYV